MKVDVIRGSHANESGCHMWESYKWKSYIGVTQINIICVGVTQMKVGAIRGSRTNESGCHMWESLAHKRNSYLAVTQMNLYVWEPHK